MSLVLPTPPVKTCRRRITLYGKSNSTGYRWRERRSLGRTSGEAQAAAKARSGDILASSTIDQSSVPHRAAWIKVVFALLALFASGVADPLLAAATLSRKNFTHEAEGTSIRRGSLISGRRATPAILGHKALVFYA